MGKRTRSLLALFLIVGMMVIGGCGVLKNNDCGCPPIPGTGKMKH